jgi:hypothetical protein
VIVIDASVLATALGDDSQDGDGARERIRGEELAAPEIVDLEVTSVWRRTLTDKRRAALALADLADLPLRRAPHLPLLLRCWGAQAPPHALTTRPTSPSPRLSGKPRDRRLSPRSRPRGIRYEVDLLS